MVGWLKAGSVGLPAGAVQNNMIVDSGAVVKALKGLIHDNGVAATKVIAAVPGRSVIMKNSNCQRRRRRAGRQRRI
jgi:Tfp pilus assembly PilM family ATPase